MPLMFLLWPVFLSMPFIAWQVTVDEALAARGAA